MNGQPLQRIQRQRTKGWRMPPGFVYVGRPTLLGNPYDVTYWGLDLALKLYAEAGEGSWNWPSSAAASLNDADFQRAARLRDDWLFRVRQKTNLVTPRALAPFVVDGIHYHGVACWCRPDARCHGDIVMQWAQGRSVFQ